MTRPIVFTTFNVDFKTPVVGYSPCYHSGVLVTQLTLVTYRGPTSHHKEIDYYGNAP